MYYCLLVYPEERTKSLCSINCEVSSSLNYYALCRHTTPTQNGSVTGLSSDWIDCMAQRCKDTVTRYYIRSRTKVSITMADSLKSYTPPLSTSYELFNPMV